MDLDNGEGAVIIKDDAKNSKESNHPTDYHIDSDTEADLIQVGEENFKQENDHCGYLDLAISKAHDDEEREKFKRWKTTISEVELNCRSIDNCTDAVYLIWLSEIASSDHFRNWPKIDEMFITLDQHFADLMHDNNDRIVCTISSYSELLRALSILHLYGDIITEDLYNWIYEQLISNLGLRPEFVYKRLNEKGWEAHAE